LTISKILSIVGVTALPLGLLTALAFSSSGERGGVTGEVPGVPASVALVREKATTALQAKAVAETAVDADPAGFRAKADGPAASEPPYSTAAIFAEADAAAKSDDPDRTTRILARLADESLVPINLRADASKRKQQLERHGKWLQNRKFTSDALHAADETMRAPPSIPNCEKVADTLEDLRRRLPQAAKTDTAASDEPGDALTADEAAEASRLRRWADYRKTFLSLKTNHAALEKSKPDELKALVEGWDRFLATNGRPGAPDPDECVSEARRLRTASRLAYLWAIAVAQDTPDTLAPAVRAWLEEPRSKVDPAGETDSRGQAATLIKTWLERHLPAPPQPPMGLAGMQEGIIDDRQAGKRLIAIFEAAPGQPKRYRWWYTAAQRKELPLGKDSGFLKHPPTPPKCIDWASRYGKIRDAYLTGFPADDGSFATECRELAEACREHMQLPALDPVNDVTAPVAGWDKLFSDAADQATELRRACHESGLQDQIRTQAP
jgi:hypothetical protein